ncbi:MAG: beta strand repeat-containing protein, partial [Sphingomonas sp.]
MSASALKIGERLRAALMQSSALGAILFAAPAHAQLSYNAPDPTVVSGSVTFDRGVAIPGTETYTVASPTAVIDFVPAAGVGNINFQNAGTTAVYQNAVNNPNFTILNRIVPADPTRQVIFNGNVVSQIQSGTGQVQGGPGPTVRGGTVWFYSPGGIIVGASSVFVVGNLLLTTGDPTSGTGIISATDTFTLASTPNAGGTVSVQPGSIINATADNSYIAMVAPAVNQAGLIRINGSAAFVAAETATLTINQGLFDISVDVGSSAAAGVPLQLRGSVTGPASLGSTDNQGIYAVAVPKNTAITMLIAPTGDLGFDVATVPTIENGGIYLQAGGDLGIFATSPAASRIRDIPQSTIAADILFRPGNVTSLVAAQASRDIEIGTLGTRVVSLEQNAFFFGQRNALLQANAGGTINAASGVTVNAFGNGVPGSATIRALGGSTISIAGEATVYADRLSGRSYPSNFDVSRGGSSLVHSAGSFSAGSVVVSAVGGNAISSASAGGTATMEAVNGGAINISGTAKVTTSAYGFGLGGTVTGGTSTVRIDGGSITTGESLSIAALGDARYTTGQASGIGGTAQLVSSPAGGLITTLGGTNIDARGIGSGAGSGDVTTGFGTGGTASVNFAATNTNATTTANLGTLLIEAGGFGGGVLTLSTAAGGAGTGGQAVLNAGVGTSVTAAETVLYADGVGGGSAVGTNSGAAVGGTARVTAGGVMNLASLKVFTSASGGTSAGLAGNGGSARAGNSVVEAIGIGALTVDESIAISSAANAGAGGGTGLGGLATAADARLTATAGGRIIATSVAVSSDAVGGNGSTGGNGTASKGSISQGSGGSVSVAGAVTISGFGQGGTATVGAGGVGRGGDLRFVSDDGTISAGSVTLNAAGTGGASDGGTVGGAGIGGIANIGARIGLTSIGGNGVDTTLIANGIGGSAIAGTASGGAGTGGQALVGTVDAGRINLSNTGYAAFLQARGIGGASLGNGTVGGLGTGGTASIFANLGSITIDGLTFISSTGQGGDKYSGTIGSAGNGIGGTSSATAGNGGRLFVNTSNMLTVSAPGLGGLISGTGTEGNGGSGSGGSANVQAFGTTGAIVDFTGPLLFDVTANGQNGVGTAGIGGSATGGTASLVVSDGRSVTVRGTVQALASATAGSGATSNATTGFAKGGAATIHAILGTLSITGAADLTGNASINAASLGHDGGDATGGTVQLLSNAGGSVTVGGALSITSQATGGTNRGGGDGIGGTGTGGLANIN